ncbi:hypothetical protein SESBI_43167 [Sesbania bispinosa]|nr:hypothetical protein SESBI_43167 [Sesbania bispinosa]
MSFAQNIAVVLQGFREGFVIGAANQLVGLFVPLKTTTENGVAKGEKVAENVGVNGVAGRESASDVGTGALVCEDPEVEVGEEASEVGEGSVFWEENVLTHRGSPTLWRGQVPLGSSVGTLKRGEHRTLKRGSD